MKITSFEYWAVRIFLLLTLAFAWYNPFYDNSLMVLEESSKKALESLGLLEALFLSAKAVGSIHFPLVAGAFNGAAESIEKSSFYLSLGNVLLLFQLILLKVTHAKVIIIALGVVWCLSISKQLEVLMFKILLLGVFVNPGLSIFTASVYWLEQQAQIKSVNTLHQDLQLVHQDYMKKEAERKEKLATRKAKQLAKDKQRGKDHLTFFQKAGDAIDKKVSNTTLHLSEDFKLTEKSIQFAAKKAAIVAINFLTSALFLYLFLPLAYGVLAYLLIGALFKLSGW